MLSFIFYKLQYIITAIDNTDLNKNYVSLNFDCIDEDENLSDENLEEYLKFLDSITWTRSGDEYMKNEDILNPSLDDLQEYLKFLDQIKWPVNNDVVKVDQKK
jgi:hypothetical protein